MLDILMKMLAVKFIEEKYKANEYVYSGVLKRKFGLTEKESIALLEDLTEEGYMEKVLILECVNCYKFYDYDPYHEKCDECDFELSLKYLYRKTK